MIFPVGSGRWSGRAALRASDATRAMFEPLERRELLAAQLLPDLQPWADASKGYLYNWSIDKVTQPGHTLLRLTAANKNIGTGVMQLIGGAANGDGTQIVNQRIHNSDGTFTDQFAGNFVYHPTHRHFHFEGFAEYDLLARAEDNSVGDLVAGGAKTSFCLEDVDAFNTALPGAPKSPVYVQCSDTIQGISVGWADVYTYQLDGQWIDITGVQDGKYWLQIVDDPQNRLAESNETNNSARIAIDLHVNDSSLATAYDAGDLATPASYDEFVGDSDPNDFYKVTLTDAASLSLKLNGMSRDADVKLLDSAGTELAKSTNGGNLADSINRALEPGTYYVQVTAFSGNTTYHLAISQGQAVAPASPTELAATPLSVSQIKLTWKDNSTTNANVIIERSTNGGEFVALPAIGDVASFTDTGLSAGVGYSYRVRAIDGNLTSDVSNVASATTLQANPTLIAGGSTWKYLDNGSNAGTSWRGISFNDSSWKSGKAQLGYGDGDEATVVKYGSSGSKKYITTYLRQSFSVADPAQIASLSAQMIRDDGAVVYLNGKEVWRSNMPSGTLSYKTLASKGITGSEESKWQSATLSKSALVAGKNVIAVEIHQNVANSQDISFDFKLTAIASAAKAAQAMRVMAVGSLFSGDAVSFADQNVLD